MIYTVCAAAAVFKVHPGMKEVDDLEHCCCGAAKHKIAVQRSSQNDQASS